MKNALLIGALAIAAGAASAKADYVVNLGNALLSGGQTVVATPALSGTLTSIDFSVNFQPDATAQSNGSWGSDGALMVSAPATGAFQWGGYDVLFPGAAFVDFWSYDGGGSAGPGPYADTRTDVSPTLTGSGAWTIAFGNGWGTSTAVQYNSITVTLHGVSAVPAPAAAGLFGLVGLGAARRRRR